MPSKPTPQTASPDQGPLSPAHIYAARRDWPMYFRAVSGKPPRDTLVFALDRFDQEGHAAKRHAVDLGCGEGRDTAELLRRGWRVTAIDGHADAFVRMAERLDLPGEARALLTTVHAPFEGLRIPPCDLLNASYALPFCPPEHFDRLWAAIVGSIRPGGRFAGQFFGERHAWAAIPDRSHQTRGEVERLMGAFEVEMFKEEEDNGNEPSGNAKHFHVFHVVARKPLAAGAK